MAAINYDKAIVAALREYAAAKRRTESAQTEQRKAWEKLVGLLNAEELGWHPDNYKE